MNLFEQAVEFPKKSGGELKLAGHDYSVKGYRKQDSLHFVLTPKNEWMPYLEMVVPLLSKKTVRSIELKIFKHNPFEPSGPYLFNDDERLKMITSRYPGIGELVSKATPFLKAQEGYPGAILRIYNHQGLLKIGCNCFSWSNPALPHYDVYTDIALTVAKYIDSNSRVLGVEPVLAIDLIDSAKIVGLESQTKELGIADARTEFGWVEGPPHPTLGQLRASLRKLAKKMAAPLPSSKTKTQSKKKARTSKNKPSPKNSKMTRKSGKKKS